MSGDGERAARPWRNWAGTASSTPARRACPRDVPAVLAVLEAARRDGLSVRPVGSGHSFSPLAATAGVQLDLRRLDRIRSLDSVTGLVTVEAGMSLHRLSELLWPARLSLTNVGDIDVQSVAGAISTGTHGTGARFGSICSQLRALELVLADGRVLTCSAQSEPEVFAAARVGLGAFGVISAVTLQCEPAFGLAALERAMPLPAVLADLEGLLTEHDHLEFYLFPHTDQALMKLNRRIAADPLRPSPRWRRLLSDELLENLALAGLARLGAALPRAIPRINAACAALYGERDYSDRSYRVFASVRRVRFLESEWALPAEALGPALAQLQRWLARPGNEIGFPLEVRFSAAEDSWLAPAHGRATAWIAAQTYRGQSRPDYFAQVARIAADHGGRPHWGKLHDLDAAALGSLYPRFADALAVRDRLDPDRLFANDHLERVLGR